MEAYAAENEGLVALYAETQLTREEFDAMGKTVFRNYEQVRKKFDCEKAFPHIYEKVSHLGRSH